MENSIKKKSTILIANLFFCHEFYWTGLDYFCWGLEIKLSTKDLMGVFNAVWLDISSRENNVNLINVMLNKKQYMNK